MSEQQERLQALRVRLHELQLDAFVSSQAENRRYLTGFTGTAGLAIVSREAAWLLVDGRYDERARREAPEVPVVRMAANAYETLQECLAEAQARRVGFEADTVSVSEHKRLTEALPDVEWVATTTVVEQLRAVKSEAEVDRLRAAAQLTDQALAFACRHVQPGMTEHELAWATEVFMREHGAEALAFEIIVAGGPNGALPHHQSGDRQLAPGEPIIIDLGARVAGYCGDLTRTFCLGAARDPLYDSVFETVERANRLAIEQLRPGMTTAELDAVAREAITAAGYGDRFVHGLGHGVGLNVHELPRLGPAAPGDTLLPGMVVTIEPGIYLPERFGVRIEDLVVIRDTGAEVLSTAAKEPTLRAQ